MLIIEYAEGKSSCLEDVICNLMAADGMTALYFTKVDDVNWWISTTSGISPENCQNIVDENFPEYETCSVCKRPYVENNWSCAHKPLTLQEWKKVLPSMFSD